MVNAASWLSTNLPSLSTAAFAARALPALAAQLPGRDHVAQDLSLHIHEAVGGAWHDSDEKGGSFSISFLSARNIF